MSAIDRTKTLTELEGDDWGPPTFASHLVTTVNRLRHKPLEQFSVEDLRITISQDIGLEYLVPIAIECLREDPFAEGDFHRGDLLVSVLKIERLFWSKYPDLRELVARIAQHAVVRRRELTVDETEALEAGFSLFDVVEP